MNSRYNPPPFTFRQCPTHQAPLSAEKRESANTEIPAMPIPILHFPVLMHEKTSQVPGSIFNFIFSSKPCLLPPPSNMHADKWQEITLYISGFTMRDRPWEELGFSKGTSISGRFSCLESDDEGVNEEMIFHSL